MKFVYKIKIFFSIFVISFVHGRLPYDLIKQDSQLRNLLRSITQRKIVGLKKQMNQIDKFQYNVVLLFIQSYVLFPDFHKFRQKSRDQGPKKVRNRRLLRPNHML